MKGHLFQNKRRILKTGIGIMAGLCLLLVVARFLSDRLTGDGPQYYIAHGGGAIDGHPVTNSLEAVENAIAHGIKYIELDLQLTSDNKLVATHDWGRFRKQTGEDPDNHVIPSYDSFCQKRILGKYRPMTYHLIDSVFKENPDLMLVTDKIRDIEPLEKYLPDIKDRITVECFSPHQYKECQEKGFKAFKSYHNLSPGGINALERNSRRLFYQHFIPTTFAVFSNRLISISDADSIFNSDKRIRFIYVDHLEDSSINKR